MSKINKADPPKKVSFISFASSYSPFGEEYINADEIAKGLSPFQSENVSFEAGRIMLHQIDELLQRSIDFAFETTLATKSFTQTIDKVQKLSYTVTLLFFWLSSLELAKQRSFKSNKNSLLHTSALIVEVFFAKPEKAIKYYGL